MKLAQCLLTFVLVARAVPASETVLTSYFPPDTRVAFGIRVHNILGSSLAQMFTSQAKTVSGDWLKSISLSGFDLLRDIDEVLVASSGEGAQPPALIVVSGRFDIPRMAESARRYHDVPLLGGDKPSDTVVALIDANTALTGPVPMVKAAIDRRDGGAHIDRALADRITSVRQRYDFWGLGDMPEGFSSPTPETKPFESIDRFQFGMLFSSGLELGAELHPRSPKDAEKLTEALQMVSAMLKSQPSTDGSKFDLQVEDGSLKLMVSIPEETLRKAILSEFTPAAGPRTTPSSDVVVTPSLAPEPTAPEPAVPELTVPVAGLPPAPPPVVAKPAPKANTSQVFDKEGNTVILRLPGKK